MKSAKRVLITGANKGIGREVAVQLARHGWDVIVSGRNVAEGQAVVAEIHNSGGTASFLEMNVSDEVSIRTAAQAFADSGANGLDVLINNAGILLDEGDSALTTTADNVLKTFQTNTVGPLLVAQAFLKFLLNGKEPRIINVSSGGGSLTHMSSWAPAYSISKAALNAVTRQLATSLSGKNVAVNSVCPGWVRTRMGGPSAPRSIEQGAETIVWLAADAPQSFTGKFFGDGKREIEW